MIELKGVTKSYSQQGVLTHAVKDVSFSVNSGEIYGIIGHSGAGKSTLIRCLAGLESLSSGTITIDGHNTSQINGAQSKALSQKIGMIFQAFNLLEQKTVFENVALPLIIAGRTDTLKATVQQLLHKVGMDTHANKYPCTLSGGQKQRVAIARALALNPKVLLCDEATSALDPESTQSILTLLKKLNSENKLTILLITHEMDVIKKICDKVGLLSEGRLVEDGPVLDIFSRPTNELTKSLISTHMLEKLPKAFQSKVTQTNTDDCEILLQLTYVGSITSEPLLSILSKEYSVIVNILLANIETVSDQILGSMLIALSGTDDARAKAITYLKSNNLIVEKVGYVQRNS